MGIGFTARVGNGVVVQEMLLDFLYGLELKRLFRRRDGKFDTDVDKANAESEADHRELFLSNSKYEVLYTKYHACRDVNDEFGPEGNKLTPTEWLDAIDAPWRRKNMIRSAEELATDSRMELWAELKESGDDNPDEQFKPSDDTLPNLGNAGWHLRSMYDRDGLAIDYQGYHSYQHAGTCNTPNDSCFIGLSEDSSDLSNRRMIGGDENVYSYACMLEKDAEKFYGLQVSIATLSPYELQEDFPEKIQEICSRLPRWIYPAISRNFLNKWIFTCYY